MSHAKANGTKALQARQAIERLLAEGNFWIGDRVPSLGELVARMPFGRMPIQQALRSLVDEGILESIPRKGHFLKRLPMPDAAPGEASSAAGNPFAPVTKRLVLALSGEMPWHAAVWRNILLQYMTRHPEIVVDIQDAALQSQTGRSAADIVQISSSALPDVVRSGRLFDPARIGGLGLDSGEFYPAALEAARHRDTLWGVPLLNSVPCWYSLDRSRKTVQTLCRVGGMWDALEEAQRLAAARKGGAPVFALGQFLTEPMREAGLLGAEIDVPELFEREAFRAFVKRYGPYFRRRDVFLPLPAAGLDSQAAANTLFEGGVLVLQAPAAWKDQIGRWCPVRWSTARPPVEPGASFPLTTMCNCISSDTLFPVECADLLRYLASYETQRAFVDIGQLVAHRAAAESAAGPKSAHIRGILAAMEQAEVLRTGRHVSEFVESIGVLEVWRWQTGQLTDEEFIDTLRLKAKLFVQAKGTREEGRRHS